MRDVLAFIAATLAAAAIALAASAPARAEIGSYLLFDMGTGEIVAMHEPTAPWYPASLTKLMTAYVTFAAIRDGELRLTSPVTISPQAFRQPPSRMGFAIGTTITVEAALRIIMTKSANDVSVALAEAVGGTRDGFEDRMNAAAARLDMASTYFDNPHGLPNRKQVTTARDMALLMMALARDFPDRADFFTMSGIVIGERRHRNYNVLIRRFEGADGMKTGFICSSGFNLAATATRDGRRLGAVVLGGLTSRERDERTAELLEKGFEAIRTGGRVALDGFGKGAEGRLDLAAVSGERPPMGTVADLDPRPEAGVSDLRPVVCGNERPATRYDVGVVTSLAEVEAAREALADWQRRNGARARARSEVLAAPRRVMPAPMPAARAAAGEGLAPSGWEPTTVALRPVRHPERAGAPDGRAPARREAGPPFLAPSGWEPAPALPVPNPLEAAGLREPIPEKPAMRPLTYLASARPVPFVAVRLGGADETRPAPLSGTVVGGGPAPRPTPKPSALIPDVVDDTDPEELRRHVEAVRADVAGAESP